MRTRALLVDYGEVISRPQPSGHVAAMAALCGLGPGEFASRYWKHRPGYDRGGDARAYWSLVVQPGALPDRVFEDLVRLDLESWRQVNPEVLDTLAAAHAAGLSLSLLSNAPHDLARALSEDPAFSLFEHLIFSSRLGLVKPEPAAFEAAVARLGRKPGEILFIDDREANVAAARACGLDALLFSSSDELRAQVSRLGVVEGTREG